MTLRWLNAPVRRGRYGYPDFALHASEVTRALLVSQDGYRISEGGER